MSNIISSDELGIDLILLNGKIITLDPWGTIAEAVAVRDGRIVKVGSTDEIKCLAGSRTRVIDLRGKTLLPGFIDSHEHCISKGLQADWVNCATPPMKSIDDIIKALAEKAAEKKEGEWIIGT
ncbi:amidohydrolase family protein, partial [Candidatus Bathyarchaeota archaeon]|nr:amidohydrolase family protein [Candidatus Bathyarchaeota archaeon]